LVEHHVAASARTFIVAHRIVKGRILAHAHQRGGFLYLQVLRLATEVSVGGSLYADRIIQEVELIEIHRKNLLFGVIAFQLYGDNPFDGFLEQTFHYVIGARRIQLLGKLLADGTSSAGVLLHQDATLHHSAEQGNGIDARMFGKTHVLRCNQRIDDVGRQVVISHEHTILLTIGISAQNLSVFREDFRCKFIIGIFQVFNGRHIANPTFCYREENNNACQCYQCYENPKDFYDFFYHVRFNNFCDYNNRTKVRKYNVYTLKHSRFFRLFLGSESAVR